MALRLFSLRVSSMTTRPLLLRVIRIAGASIDRLPVDLGGPVQPLQGPFRVGRRLTQRTQGWTAKGRPTLGFDSATLSAYSTQRQSIFFDQGVWHRSAG